eukprot:TRINITY_DN1050_c0_g1_i5.p1 TRINITY_DN1050_c0_g1~~TRINITY_DN1050_c0_g1_i5.p1  ORF type:complete len:790 (-),score=238.19 TRINITY_DN1050_c0_g1_i5:374-2743(-)
MKGLTINCLGDDRKEEAYELVKKGIMHNMMSHVCWHVYGLLYRSDRKYNDAIKSYTQALKRDKDNLQILRDLALLQIHMRDLHGGLKTRHTLLTLKPTVRANWMGFALANHMLNRHSTAIKVLESYENIGDETDSEYELSELVLYKNTILKEAGMLSEAHDQLMENEAKVCDKLSFHEMAASLLLDMGRNQDAAAAYRKLIDINVDNLKYHYGLQKALGLCETAQDRLLEEYEGLKTKYPRSNAPLRICLDFTTGSAFKKCADVFVRKFLRRGIPSLFSDLKPLYTDSSKVELLSSLYLELHDSLEKTGCFPASDTEPEPPTEGPMVIMWLELLLANHYDRTGSPLEALRCIEKGVEHTPTCIELQMCKARVLKHHGDQQQAAQVMDKARGMDLADRYLNTRSVVYLLRADEYEQAERVVVLFTKEELTGGNNLYDMQCMWWEVETGNSFIRQRRYGEALKKLTAVEKHFEDIHEDQFDFHSYCLRKMTLRAYMAMLRTEDQIRTNKFFLKAAQAIIQLCLELHTNPPAVDDPEAEFAGMDDKQRKKALKKKQREEKKKAEALDKARAEHAKNKKKGPLDEDPLGEQLLQQTLEAGVLVTATKYAKLLQQAWPDQVVTHVLCYKTYLQLGKHLLCAQALLRAVKIDATDPDLHSCLIEFCLHVQANTDIQPVVAQVLSEVVQELLGEHAGVQALSDHYRCTVVAKGSAAHMMAAAKSWVVLDASKLNEAAQFVSNLQGSISFDQAIQVHQLLEGWLGANDERTKQYFQACASKFPVATYFNPGAAPGEE